MPTDISSIKKMYRSANDNKNFPETIEINFRNEIKKFSLVNWKDNQGNQFPIRYGTNPNQLCAFYKSIEQNNLSIGNLNFFKIGKGGPSLTNLEDINRAFQILKYFSTPAITIMKHLNPSGVAVQQDKFILLKELFCKARDCDSRSAFGGVIVSNREIDSETAREIMKSFFEIVAAPKFSDEALQILNDAKKYGVNKDLRIIEFSNLEKIPKFDGDNIDDLFISKIMCDGSIAIETPFLTSIRSKENLILDAQIGNVTVKKIPTQNEIEDLLIAWHICINVRSNAIVFVKNGTTLAIGTGQQERIGAVEQAILKAKQKNHSLKNSVMASDAFFPNRDSIDIAAKEGITSIIFPGGSINDAEIIKAANENNISLAITGERCFAHF